MTNKKRKFVPTKIDPDFKKELDDIKLERIKLGFDKKLRGDRRITKAIRRASIWKDLKKIIVEADLEDEDE